MAGSRVRAVTPGEPTSPLVTAASIGTRLVISEGFAMHQFSGTIPRPDNWSSSKTGRALGPSEAKHVVFHEWVDRIEAPLYQAWGGGNTAKDGWVLVGPTVTLLEKMFPLVVSEPVSTITIPISQMGKLRPSGVKLLVQGLSARKWWSWDIELMLRQSPRPWCFNKPHRYVY